MKILLFGGSGQLGFELKKRAHDLEFEVISPVTSEVNIIEAEQVKFLTKRVRPEVVINAAAYTAVDKAEAEPEAAMRVNRDGARIVAEACREVGARMIHISTDYVFDGLGGHPLKESDPTNPRSVYGRSKLEGEQEVHEVLGANAAVVRTSSLHGQHGVNFVHTMIKLFKEREVVKVVNDQTMSPTWAGWLAEGLLDLARTTSHGVFHASCQGGCTWFEFAEAILDSLRKSDPGIKLAALQPTSAAELSRPAPRPVFSVFDTQKITAALGRAPIPWQEGLRSHLKEIGITA